MFDWLIRLINKIRLKRLFKRGKKNGKQTGSRD
jgi:hypothetical protein